jgi:hypothetical protein
MSSMNEMKEQKMWKDSMLSGILTSWKMVLDVTIPILIEMEGER